MLIGMFAPTGKANASQDAAALVDIIAAADDVIAQVRATTAPISTQHMLQMHSWCSSW